MRTEGPGNQPINKQHVEQHQEKASQKIASRLFLGKIVDQKQGTKAEWSEVFLTGFAVWKEGKINLGEFLTELFSGDVQKEYSKKVDQSNKDYQSNMHTALTNQFNKLNLKEPLSSDAKEVKRLLDTLSVETGIQSTEWVDSVTKRY